MPLQIPSGDAARLTVDVKNLFYKLASEDALAALRSILAGLPPGSDVAAAAKAGLDAAQKEAMAPQEDPVDQAKALLSGGRFQEARALAERQTNHRTRWKILALMAQALKGV
jgi:hypothetical protein